MVLRPLKAQMEEDMGVTLPLADEEGGQSYSDISLILRTYLDVSAAYVRHYYNGSPPVIPPVLDNWAATLIRTGKLPDWATKMTARRRPRVINDLTALEAAHISAVHPRGFSAHSSPEGDSSSWSPSGS